MNNKRKVKTAVQTFHKVKGGMGRDYVGKSPKFNFRTPEKKK